MSTLTKIVQGTEHAIAAGWQDAIKIGHFVETSVVPVLQKAEVDAPQLAQIAALAGPKASALEALLFGGGGIVAKSLTAISSVDATATDAAAGKSVTVDITDLVAAFKALV